MPIVGDAREVLVELIPAVRAEYEAGSRVDLTGWWQQLDQWRETYPLGYEDPPDGALSPQYVIERLGKIAGPETIFAAGVGQHQMWAAQFIDHERPRHWLNSGGLGTMGYAVPAAMGAKVGTPESEVWAIDGDAVEVGLGVALVVEQRLPLADHAEVSVVDDRDLHRDALDRAGG